MTMTERCIKMMREIEAERLQKRAERRQAIAIKKSVMSFGNCDIEA